MPHSLRNELWKACRADRSLVLRASVVLVLGLIANVLTPWPLKFIIDEVLGKGSLFGFRFTHFSELTSKTLLILCLTVLSFLLICSRGFFNHLRHILLTQIGDRSSDRLRVRVFAHLLKVDLTSLSHFALDDLRARANEDLDRIRDCMIEVFAVVIGELVTVIVTFAILFSVDPTFAFLTVIFLALLFAVYHIFPRAIDQRNLTARALEADRAIFTSEIVRHQMFVKAWTRESVEICRLEKKNRSCSSASLAKATGEGRLIFLVEILTALMTASVLGYGGWSVVVGRLSFGGMVLFMQYLAFLYAPIGRMSGFFLIYQRGRVGWQRIQEVLRLPSESSTPTNQRSDWQVPSSRESAPEIRFHRVSFGYQSHQLVLSNFSMTLRAGEITAMTGKSGAGKSTLLKLLMGFHLLDEGEILLDQVPISKMALHDLRSQIAYVDQEATLFSGTVLDNLVYGSENVDEYRLRIVCQQLEIDSFVANLPDGYQTCMRDGGTCFSVGQRQRIALGRALASNRQIIIMDEPTAALDPDLESKVVRELVGLLAGRTALIVTHRPKPLCIASQIIELGENLDISRRRPHFEAVT